MELSEAEERRYRRERKITRINFEERYIGRKKRENIYKTEPVKREKDSSTEKKEKWGIRVETGGCHKK